MAAVIPFPQRRPVVFVDVVPDDGGSWAVFVQRPGHVAKRVAVRFALDSAMAAARQIAQQRGADLLEDAPPEPLGAA